MSDFLHRSWLCKPTKVPTIAVSHFLQGQCCKGCFLGRSLDSLQWKICSYLILLFNFYVWTQNLFTKFWQTAKTTQANKNHWSLYNTKVAVYFVCLFLAIKLQSCIIRNKCRKRNLLFVFKIWNKVISNKLSGNYINKSIVTYKLNLSI